jgi:uncharacterized protein YjbJ (UPF0337 family)
MNTDTLAGNATTLGGQVKEGLGNALGDNSLRGEGKADQASGTAQRTFGEAKDAVQPMIDQARQFMRDRPFAAAALGGVVGFALLNTLRGK